MLKIKMILFGKVPRHIVGCLSLRRAITTNRGHVILSNYSCTKVHRVLTTIDFRYYSSISAQPVAPTLGKKLGLSTTLNDFQTRSSSTKTKKVEHFILPDIGEGINEVIIREWQVKVGDSVKEFDEICVVESDKATAAISSRFEGIITKVHYEVGDMAKVGKPLVDIETMSSDSGVQTAEPEVQKDSDSNHSNQKEPLQKRDPRTSSEQLPIAVLPSVRRLAKENSIDLRDVKPSGKHGRILKEDVLAYLEKGAGIGDRGCIMKSEPKELIHDISGFNSETIIPLRGIQRAMYKTMTQSLKIPHFSYSDEIDMTRLVESSRRLREAGNASEKIGNFAFIIKMVSLALLDYPQLNASLDDNGESLIQKNYHNIGIAVDTQAGLVVPNIKNVQSLSIKEINLELTRLRELGYASKLSPRDLSGGTFTLSNIGAIGGIFGIPVIVSPEIVIGALGRTRTLPRFNEEGCVEQRHIMQLVWSADHRVVDGASLSRFTNLLKQYLENPESALLRLA